MLGWNEAGIAGVINEQRPESLAREGINMMKPWFIRIFASAMLTHSILAFGAGSPCKDEKMPACPAPVASAPQTSDDEHCAKKVKKEKKVKKKRDPEKQDNYPGYGVFG